VADKAANRGVIHRNKANRIKSRAAKLVAAAK
jgi:ribosomal protein S20